MEETWVVEEQYPGFNDDECKGFNTKQILADIKISARMWDAALFIHFCVTS